jgi:hypothetical protein
MFRNKQSLIDPDSNLVALTNGSKNWLEIRKLEAASPAPHLQTLCFFQFPPLKSDALCIILRWKRNGSPPLIIKPFPIFS